MLNFLLKMKLIAVILNFKIDLLGQTFATVYQGARLGDFPAPVFKQTIKAFPAQGKKGSFKRISLPAYFTSVPALVKVYASTQDGDSAGFRFEGTGACQNPGSSGNYGGIMFAYNFKEVYLWAPTKYSGNTNGKLIYVEDGWGGEKYTQSSRIADVTVEAWSNLPTPNFQTEIQVDAMRSYYEVPHKLKQIPDYISIRVFARNSKIFKKEFLFHFHASGSTQSLPSSTEYGGVIYSYNETFVRLWLPNSGNGLNTGCIKITKGWGKGKYAEELNSDTCQVEIRAWVTAFPLPAFQTEWRSILANAHQKSFKEIHHNLGVDSLVVQVQIKEQGINTNGFIYDGLGSVQSTQSDGELYGGVLFAYDKSSIRIWVASSDTGNNGRAIFISDAWGNGTHVEKHEKAWFRVRVFAHLCKSETQIADGQGICRDAEHTGLVWQTSSWGNCSSTCGAGKQQKKLTGCHAVKMKTVFSCDFESSSCGFTTSKTSHKWMRSRGSAEQKERADGFTQPLYGFQKGSYFIYSVIKGLHAGSYVQLISPQFAKSKNCNLKFDWNTGVYYNLFEIHVLSSGNWKIAWKMSDKQPGNPYIWYAGYLNMENQKVEQFRFTLRLRDRCYRHCGYVAFDNIRLECEAEDTQLVSMETCERRAVPLPGCLIDVFQPLHKGPAFTVITSKHEYYTDDFVKADGTMLQSIANYTFRVERDGFYTIWIDFLGTNRSDNSVSYFVDHKWMITAHLVVAEDQPVWNCLNSKGVFLITGVHTITLVQFERGFRYRAIRVAPKYLSAWSSLGMQNLHINDFQLQSSLQRAENHEKAPHIRLNGQGAWMTNDENYGWLQWQITFPDVALVNRVAIQGGCKPRLRPCCSSPSFELKFSIDGDFFWWYRNSTGLTHRFQGSYSQAPNFAVESQLEYAVPARGVQFYPYNHNPLTCLRVEVYGTYLTKPMCTHTGVKPILVRSCTGDRKCGKNAECSRDASLQGSKIESCDCSPGFHGPTCTNVNCEPNPCLNGGMCKIADGMFKCVCKPGYMGRLCQMSCPSDKFGPGCNETCVCAGNSRCHSITGACFCETGYTGQKCDQQCPQGYYGANCERACKCSSLTICDPVTGSCYCPFGLHGQLCEKSCLQGFYGRNCSFSCECARHAKCLPTNGTCVCPRGWFGKHCTKECPDGRYGSNCVKACNCSNNAVCGKYDGSCVCKMGWMGRSCERRCPKGSYGMACLLRCDHCSWDTTDDCDHVTGQCICKAGFVGKRCQDRCTYNTYGSGCKQRCKCRNDASCDRKDGTCRCRAGYTGMYCENTCPRGRFGTNCSGVCKCLTNQTDACDFIDGTCECNPGFKGNECHQTCQKGYWGKNCDFLCYCNHDAYCDPFNGICSCTSGWEGEYCDTPCNNAFYGPGCKQRCKCRNGAVCDRFNGSCTCAQGFIGEFCVDRCPEWTFGKNCNRSCSCKKDTSDGCSNTDGACYCKAGYQGSYCDKVCDDGTYGRGCYSICPSCPQHVTGPCDKKTGGCPCSLGYYGDKCKNHCPLGKYGHFCTSICNCTGQEICSHIDGVCYKRVDFEFFVNLLLGNVNVVAAESRLAVNLERLMAKYYPGFIRPVSVRRRETGERSIYDVTKLKKATKHVSDSRSIEFDQDKVVSNSEKYASGLGHVFSDSNEGNSNSNKTGLDSGRASSFSDEAAVLLKNVEQIQSLPRDSDSKDDFMKNVKLADSDTTDDESEKKMLIRLIRDLGNTVDQKAGEIRDGWIHHPIVRREVMNTSLGCNLLSASSNISAFSVRITSIWDESTNNGETVLSVGFVAMYNGIPQKRSTMDQFVKLMPNDCLLAGFNCQSCLTYNGKLDGNKSDTHSVNVWIIIGPTAGGVIVCLSLAIYLIIQRKRQNIAPTIYKVKKNSRDIELRPCLANGDGSHVLAFENPYYDVIAAMGLDDDIEEDYYNPLYTYDDVSLYCDDQASDSGTETNNDDGYHQYPYDRDSGISSGTIHQ